MLAFDASSQVVGNDVDRCLLIPSHPTEYEANDIVRLQYHQALCKESLQY
jgi:hypothetical protein